MLSLVTRKVLSHLTPELQELVECLQLTSCNLCELNSALGEFNNGRLYAIICLVPMGVTV